MQRSRRPSFRLQRLARGGFARLFAHAMAVLLVLANLSAWAMPAVQTPGAMAPRAASAAAHHHCDEIASPAHAGKDKAAHGKGCPCCVGGACACLHSCSAALDTGLPDLASLPAASLPQLDSAVFFDAGGERRLRPPIA
ncbi:hypothetical protein [Rudaea sp.]|uniref:hypothetical protein n=1 Tax=Rudaea sp. TaxID=2136325 RepID=UPI00321F6ABA